MSLAEDPVTLTPTNVEILRRVFHHFVSRRDAYATESRAGEWFLARERGLKGNYDGPPIPMGMSLLSEHLAGQRTVGHYLLNPQDDTAKFVAFDIDLSKSGFYMPVCAGPDGDPTIELNLVRDAPLRKIWADRGRGPRHEAETYLEALLLGVAQHIIDVCRSKTPFPVLLADSGGKGLHVYLLTGPKPAKTLVANGALIMERFVGFHPTKGNNFWSGDGIEGQITVEVFPKQATVGDDGFGNLMRLPLGLHGRTRRRFQFLDFESDNEGNWPSALDPTDALPEVP